MLEGKVENLWNRLGKLVPLAEPWPFLGEDKMPGALILAGQFVDANVFWNTENAPFFPRQNPAFHRLTNAILDSSWDQASRHQPSCTPLKENTVAFVANFRKKVCRG